MHERTLVIVKPDAIKRELIGDILLRFEREGLHVLAMKMIRIGKHDAERFYAEHEGKPFFKRLTNMVSDMPIIPIVFFGENAICRVREIIGATDPTKAADGTIRHDYALDTTRNSVHGSDCPESARREIAFFFSESEICHSCEIYWQQDQKT
jgi:nucleoside-diphosphate kinase